MVFALQYVLGKEAGSKEEQEHVVTNVRVLENLNFVMVCLRQKLLPLTFLSLPPPPPPKKKSFARHPMCGAPQEAGVQLGDILEQLDGVYLGSFQEAIERLKQRRGTVVLTLLRQKD